MRTLVHEIEESDDSSNRMFCIVLKEKSDPQNLKLAKVEVYGASIFALLDSGSISDVTSTALDRKLHLASSSTKRCITMVYYKEAAVIDELSGVPIEIGPTTVDLLCLVVQTTPYHLIVRRPSMKFMRATLDFDSDVVTFLHAPGVSKASLVAEGTQENASLTNVFTTDEYSDGNGA